MAEPSFIKLYTNFEESTNIKDNVIPNGKDFISYEYPKNNPNAMTVSTAQKRAGTKSAKITLKPTDSEAEWGNKRVEITYNNWANPDTSIRWHSFSRFMPSGTYKPDREEEIIVQWHDKSSGCSTSPALAIETKDGRYRVARRFSVGPYCVAANRRGPYYTDLGPIEYDKQTDYIVYYDPRIDSKGKIIIWINGKEVFNYTGITHYDGSVFPYFKIGLYKWGWMDGKSDTTIREFYLDEIRLGDINGNLQYFLGLNGGSGEPVPPNLPPIVNIISSGTIDLPTPVITLTAMGSDPENGAITYQWTQASGKPALIDNPTSAIINATLQPGDSMFKVTVTDEKGLFSSDTVTVTLETMHRITIV